MRLNVLPPTRRPWYADGLHFQCTSCGNCCTGGPGFVWITSQEIHRLAPLLNLSPDEVMNRYCRPLEGRYSLKEVRTSRGEYDCIFLKYVDDKRTCSIYPARPLQCRTWPFWDGNLAGIDAWNRAAQRCPGINRGQRAFTHKQIESLRAAKDWPTESICD